MRIPLRSIADSPHLILWLICMVGFAIVACTGYRSGVQILDLFLEADGDDQMRLMEVRDWLAGQSWWDTRQYRVLPPDGISMHWSRYIDAAIGFIILAASSLVPVETAELAALILWPSLLACVMVIILTFGTARILGIASSIGAVATFLSWGKLGGEFVPPRIDHHNVQILCGTALFYLAIIPGRPWFMGALGGIVTAFSLAIGLELLPYYATIWGLVALRHAFGQAGTGPWLLGFGGGITLSAPLFFAGQTPLSVWGTPWCDVLATPVMALGLVGVIATTTPVLAASVLKRPLWRIAGLAGITALGVWMAFPLLGQCLAGPYSGVSAEVRSIIENDIIEALSFTTLAANYPYLLGRVLLPPVVIAALALVTVWQLRDRITPLQATALVQAFVVLAVGLGFALVQIRAANLMTPAVPFLAGFLFYAFTLVPRQSWLRVPAVLMLLLSLPAVVEKAVVEFMPVPKRLTSTDQTPRTALEIRNCRTETAMAELSRVPPALMFSTVNLGPTIITFTPHSTASAAYHRSIDAFWNGLGAFTSEDTLRAALETSGADYVVLCAGSRVERDNPWTRAMLAGNLPDWLSDVTVDRTELRLLKVDKAKIAGRAP